MKQFVQNFNNLVKKTIFKVKNKTNNKFQISAFNKYLIAFISLLFFYLFYLSIPVLYDKTWIQNNIESKLLKEFKINFSISSNISYRILPAPHYLIKDSKIFKEKNDTKVSFADIKNLKVFVSQKNFFDKEKITFKYIKINKANISILKNNINLLKDISDNKFSKKKIEINDSNIFFKNNLGDTKAIIKVSKAFLFLDDDNLFNLKGNIFNVPFKFGYKSEFNYPNNKEINITAKKLKLKIFDIRNNKKDNLTNGKNIISFLNNKIKTDYKILNNLIVFNSSSTSMNNSKVNYNGKLSVNPFDLNLNINLGNYEISKIFNISPLLIELIKSELLFNKNISVNSSIIATSDLKQEIFQNAIVNFDIINGKININKTKLINDKVGSLEFLDSDLFFKNDELTLNTDIEININNHDELFSLLQLNKKSRKIINNIFINLDYNFLTEHFEFNNIKIDNKELSDESYRIIQGFNNKNFNNWNKSRRLLNALFENYDG